MAVFKPLVGVISDRRVLDHHAFHLVGEKYLTALTRLADVLPICLPVLAEDLHPALWLARLDGLLLTGSPSDVEPWRYGGAASADRAVHDPHRDELAMALIEAVICSGVPLLGICRGLQEINVALGGSLHQAVHEVQGLRRHHENPDDPVDVQYAPVHRLAFRPQGMLARITGLDGAIVNSVHRQGVQVLARRAVAEATAPDGLIEAFTVADSPGWVLAVQWHPEWQAAADPVSRAIFQDFGDACQKHANQRCKTQVTN